jgi:hypothetical protein
MRHGFAAAFMLALAMSPGALAAEPLKLAVFDLELVDTSVEGARADQEQRLVLATAELRRLLEAQPDVKLVDLAPQAEAIRRAAPLRNCNGCDAEIARALGADYEVLGRIQKTSNLILSFLIELRDLRSGRMLRAGQVDIRGNTDDTWLRGVRWVVKNRLLTEPLPRPS